MKTRKSLAVLCGLSVALCVSTAATAAQLSGRVTDSGGNGLAGLMVSAKSSTGIEVTVFTAGDGSYALTGLLGNGQTVTAKGPGWLSATQVVSVPLEGGAGLDIKLTGHPDAKQDLSGAHWMGLLPDGGKKREFMINCVSCHEIGHARVTKDGQARSAAQWAEAIALMRSTDVYRLTPPDFHDAAYAVFRGGGHGERWTHRVARSRRWRARDASVHRRPSYRPGDRPRVLRGLHRATHLVGRSGRGGLWHEARGEHGLSGLRRVAARGSIPPRRVPTDAPRLLAGRTCA